MTTDPLSVRRAQRSSELPLFDVLQASYERTRWLEQNLRERVRSDPSVEAAWVEVLEARSSLFQALERWPA